MEANRFVTVSLRDLRIARILAAAFAAVEPGTIVSNYLEKTALPAHSRVFILGLGKAAEPMVRAAANSVGEFAAALIITKHRAARQVRSDGGSVAGGNLLTDSRVRVLEAGHPIPDDRSLAAGRVALAFVSQLEANDLLICLISGGGSALVTVPPPGVTLADLQLLTASLLASGANIEEINILRRQLDRLKGGGLAAATRAMTLSLILSDVAGDHLEAIASGPTAPNPTTQDDALAILKKYGIRPPHSIQSALRNSPPRGTDLTFTHVRNVVVGNNQTAALAASTQAEAEGLSVELLAGEIQGEARLVGRHLAERLKATLPHKPRPFCIIAGGETTVRVSGRGKGGRNQELALAAVDVLDGLDPALFISVATDGEDGRTDAAGAVVTQDTRRRATQLGLVPEDYLSRNDAYPFFEALGDLLKPGYTGTNVNDLMFLLGL
jgi:hydroxypyruvate reductase